MRAVGALARLKDIDFTVSPLNIEL
jgi:hypothetical protein